MIEQQEILFRGKRVYNGKWVEGGYWCNKTATRISFYIIDNDGNSYKVIPETISQFTGRSDKYGEKIFGGDVLKGYQYPFLSDGVFNYYAEVIWFDNCPAFGIYTFKAPGGKGRGASTGNTSYMEDWQPELWEVIGNVHDTPRPDFKMKNFKKEKKFADYAGCSILEATMRYGEKHSFEEFSELSENAAKSWLRSCRHALWVALEYFGTRTGEQDLEAYHELDEICEFEVGTIDAIVHGRKLPAHGQGETLMAFFEVEGDNYRSWV